MQCSQCLRIYTFDEYLALPQVKAVESDTDPKSQHGYTSVCKCGAVFHRDRWHRSNVVATRDGAFKVSTVHLEVDHSLNGKPPIWYETMIFLEDGHFDLDEPQWRYSTKDAAITNHYRLLQALAGGKYVLRTVREVKRLDIDD
jgi:hypothetical protein